MVDGRGWRALDSRSRGFDVVVGAGRRHRRLVLDHLAVASFDERAEARLRTWLSDELPPREPTPPALEGEVNAWFARERVSRPASTGSTAFSARRAAYDDAALRRVADRLDADMRERLDVLLADADEGTGFARLAADPGRVGLESLLAEIAKLERLRGLGLPPDLLRGAHPEQIKALSPARRDRDGLGAAPSAHQSDQL
jgi:hypothetical protein